jgi:hypothetical protein
VEGIDSSYQAEAGRPVAVSGIVGVDGYSMCRATVNPRTMVASKQRAIVEAGKRIYEPYRSKLEARARGQFAVVDIATGELFMAPSPEEASRKTRDAGRNGPFYLLRIGFRAAYRSRRAPHGSDTRFIR